ncbi:MAG: FtsL-like putative cell division protein [Prolixibacteraceae bacterium]|jgi:hypothetical protein|nr:FtsL-like putative cell division protein [Prolixibacteraceae bacterium]
MSEEKENIGKKKIQPVKIKRILGGSVLASEKVMAQLPFVFFLVLLGLAQITNRNWAEKTIRKMEAVQDTLKELRAESITHETRLMSINRPSEVVRRVTERNLGLVEPKEPAMKIKVKKSE